MVKKRLRPWPSRKKVWTEEELAKRDLKEAARKKHRRRLGSFRGVKTRYENEIKEWEREARIARKSGEFFIVMVFVRHINRIKEKLEKLCQTHQLYLQSRKKP